MINYKFNKKHINKFNSDGYLYCKKFFDTENFYKIKKYIKEIENFKNVKKKWMKYYDPSLKNKNKIVLTRIENFYDYHKKLKKILSNKVFKNQIKKLVGNDVVLFKDKINFKYPGSKGFKPHQDATIWKDMYGIKSFITLAISIDESTIENGCLRFARIKNKKLISKYWNEIPKKIEKKMKWKIITQKPGDVVFFNDYSPHKSSDNFSNKKRRMVFLTYNEKKFGDFRKKHFRDKRRNFPPNIERKKGEKYVFHV